MKQILLLIFIFYSNLSHAQSESLFLQNSPLQIKIEAPFKDLFLHKNNFSTAKNYSVTGYLFSANKAIPIEIRLRGFSTLMCPFPKMMIKILDQKMALNTEFSGLHKVDLATHCGMKTDELNKSNISQVFKSMANNHREALIYDWLRILGIPSYKTRMVSITYSDSTLPLDPLSPNNISKPAFFVEHLSAFLREYQNAKEIRGTNDRLHDRANDAQEKNPPLYIYNSISQSPRLDKIQLAKIALFQSLIANSDWNLDQTQQIWNLKILQLANGSWLPIPMDFNLSLITNDKVESMYFAALLKKEYYNFANNEQKRLLIQNYFQHRAELYKSIETLGNDIQGKQYFKETLDAWFEYLSVLLVYLKD